jgi:hypothetical protein
MVPAVDAKFTALTGEITNLTKSREMFNVEGYNYEESNIDSYKMTKYSRIKC